jgi:hypothetical protein
MGKPNKPPWENSVSTDFDGFASFYSKEDMVADAVVFALYREGIRCWYPPRGTTPGADWTDSILQAIHLCKRMRLVFTKKANCSPRVINDFRFGIWAGRIFRGSKNRSSL